MKQESFQILALHGNLGFPSDWDLLEGSVQNSSWDKPCLWDLLREDPRLDLVQAGKILADQIRKKNYDLLLGYSLGGRLLLHALAELRDSCAKALLLSTNLAIPEKESQSRVEWDEEWSRQFSNDPIEKVLKKWNALPIFSEDISKELSEKLFCYQAEISLAFKNWSLGKQEFDSFSLMQIPSVVRLVTGSHDERCTENNRYWGAYLERSTHTILEGGGHRLIQNHVSEVSAVIREMCIS